MNGDAYDAASAEQKALVDRMLVEIEQGGLDTAKVSAMEGGLHLDEEALVLVTLGVKAGFVATAEWFRREGLIRPDA